MRVVLLVFGLVGCQVVFPLTADGDQDGVDDERDNCIDLVNPGQEDEDNDGIGDACDNCPHLANHDQAESDDDELGDICDDDPSRHDCIVLFDGFANHDHWLDDDARWLLANGTASQTVPTGDTALHSIAGFASPYIETKLAIDDFVVGQPRNIQLFGFADGASPIPNGILVGAGDPTTAKTQMVVGHVVGGVSTVIEVDLNKAVELAGAEVVLTLDLRSAPLYHARLDITDGLKIGNALHDATDSTMPDVRLALRTIEVAASFQYVLVEVAGQTCPGRQ